MKQRAIELFRGKEGYNCAQAVLAAFEEDVPQEKLAEYKGYGGGRSEGGWCGALYSAQNLTKTEAQRDLLTKEFEKVAGGVRCKEIRKLNRIDCRTCVATAAELAEKMLKKS